MREGTDRTSGAWERLLESAVKALPEYLLRQRWYPSKDAGLPLVRLSALIPLQSPDFSAAVAVWTATPPGRPAVHIFLPVATFTAAEMTCAHPARIASAPDGVVVGDAFASDEFVRAFVRLMVDAEPTSFAPPLKARRTAFLERAGMGKPGWPIERSTAEQSNTSIRIGDRGVLKVLRKLAPGVHPELEMGRFLTEEANFGAIAPLLGWIDVNDSTVAILQAFVPNQGDGWSWVLERLQRGSREEAAEALRWVEVLGKRTAEMHLALSGGTDDPAFSPESVGAQDVQSWTEDVKDMALRVVDALKERRAQLDPESRAIAVEFERSANELEGSIEHLAASALGTSKTRHHGDFHLGQVLVRSQDATIVDFEGEPLRSLEERRAKHSPLRDVAGMLRSFSYVAAVADRDLPNTLTAQAREACRTRLKSWSADASRRYVQSYFAALSQRSGPLLGEAKGIELVKFFCLQKALYEVLYEIANRPAWVSIPLNGIVSLLQGSDATLAPEAPATNRSAHRHSMPYGTEIVDGGVRFRFWAPKCHAVRLALESRESIPMESLADGWHEIHVPNAAAGWRYQFELPDGMRVPDPASRFQPEDVHGPSAIVDPASYSWRASIWAGRPWHEAVVYELHVGTFTSAGTFRAAIERLDHLVRLGITAVELMPIADFPGGRNWGYDGVLLYAPDSTYGTPEDLKAFVEAAHERHLMVLLDVVYNHFGPDGNYLPVYAPLFFTDRHKTPWGAAVNFDGEHSAAVREFVIHNALYWLEEFQFDGLRLDAVHSLVDDGPNHILTELADRARALGRPVHLLLENEENEASLLMRDASGAPLHYTAQWNDDIHHVLHVATTGEGQGYYADYRGDTAKLARALAEGFAFQGEMMEFRGEPRGEPSALLPPTAFVAFIQNHDQIGNRAFGERLTAIAPREAIRAAAAIYLLLPQVPMLFMGEEWAASQPFPFFCDFGGELAEAVRKGRREEFARFPEFQDEAKRARIPDPQSNSTFVSAKLDWSELDQPGHAAWLEFYQRLLAGRRESIVPLLPHIRGNAAHYRVIGPGAVTVRWDVSPGGGLELAANLSSRSQGGFPAQSGRALWLEGTANEGTLGPWSVRWSMASESP